MNRKVWLTVFVSMCFLSAVSLTQFMVSVRAASLTQFMVSVRASSFANVTVSQAKAMIESTPDLQILDVRSQSEYDSGHIKNAILIPHTELPGRLDELDKNKDTLVYCKLGGRSAYASGVLDGAGFTSVYNMLGGISAWIAAGYPIEIVFEDAVWEGTIYPVATFSNSTITSFSFNQPLKQISFNVEGTDGTTGICNVTIPIVLLDGSFRVLVNEVKTGYTLTKNASHSFVYFSYSHTTKQVKIVGTTVIGVKAHTSPVGGIWIPVDKLAILAPYISLALTIILAIAVTAAFFKYRKKQ